MYRQIHIMHIQPRRQSQTHFVRPSPSTIDFLLNVTVLTALGIVYLFKEFAPTWDSSRISIKIPGTWEGMMACRTLQLAGVHTLATTLFSMTQAVLAAEVGCTYVAPYVNQLKVHFEPGLVPRPPFADIF
jgi:Transaldolase/Fructose-6-phosphate aldolase